LYAEKEEIEMWFEKRGIVLKTSDRYCIVLTPDGSYEKIALPVEGAQVGAEIVYRSLPFGSKKTPLLLVASLLIVFMSFALFRQAGLPQAAAYVSLDINPSLEMAVDKDLNVIDVQCFNDDAGSLIQPEELQGKNLYDAFEEVIKKAIEQNYIKPGEDNLIISTVSLSGTKPVQIDQEAVGQFLEKTVAANGYTGQVTVYSASDEIRTTAKSEGLSSGKYLVYQQLVKSGTQVSVDEVKKNSVRELVSEYKVPLIPDNKKFTVKKTKNGEEAEIDVDDDGNSVSIKDYIKNHHTRSESAKNQDKQSKDKDDKKDNRSRTSTKNDDQPKMNDNTVRMDDTNQDKRQTEINKDEQNRNRESDVNGRENNGNDRGRDDKDDRKSPWRSSNRDRR